MTDSPAKPAVLLADIGGTNSRFALAGSDGRPAHTLIIENDQSPNLEGAIARYLAETGARPSAAVLAIAGPIGTARRSRSPIAPGGSGRGELAQRFGFAKLRLVNDFEAIAWALTRLTAADAHPLGPPLPAAPRRARSCSVPAPGSASRRSCRSMAAGTCWRARAAMPRSVRRRRTRSRSLPRSCTSMAASAPRPSCRDLACRGCCAPSIRDRRLRRPKPWSPVRLRARRQHS